MCHVSFLPQRFLENPENHLQTPHYRGKHSLLCAFIAILIGWNWTGSQGQRRV